MGFYSGEEDMEFSSFSSGTERAVKTWQVSCKHLSVELIGKLCRIIKGKNSLSLIEYSKLYYYSVPWFLQCFILLDRPH